MKPNSVFQTICAILIPLCLAITGCLKDSISDSSVPQSEVVPLTLYVGGSSKIAAYDLATGEQKAGELGDVSGLVDMQALEDGTVLVNNGVKNNILVFNGKTLLEYPRIVSSAGALKPTHSFLTTPLSGKQYYVALNDGNGVKATNSVLFIDANPTSKDYLHAVGEARLGIGHHKAAFSKTKARVSISNIGDCDEVIKVFDYSDITTIKNLATYSAKDLGFDGSSKEKTCDATRKNGVSLSPHGSATAPISGRAYHNLTGVGLIASVDQDQTPPTVRTLATHGSGGGYTKYYPGSDIVYSLQSNPREGNAANPGLPCQIGQLVVIDASKDSVIHEIPLFLKGGDCQDSITGTPYAKTGPDHMVVVASANRLFIQGGNSDTAGYSSHHLVLDITDAKNPKQLATLNVGKSRGHHAETLSGDGKWIVEANNLDNSVSVIDVAKGQVIKTLNVVTGPAALTTWGSEEGPSHHVGPVE